MLYKSGSDPGRRRAGDGIQMKEDDEPLGSNGVRITNEISNDVCSQNAALHSISDAAVLN